MLHRRQQPKRDSVHSVRPSPCGCARVAPTSSLTLARRGERLPTLRQPPHELRLRLCRHVVRQLTSLVHAGSARMSRGPTRLTSANWNPQRSASRRSIKSPTTAAAASGRSDESSRPGASGGRSLQQATFDQRGDVVELLIDRVVVTDDAVEIRYVSPTTEISTLDGEPAQVPAPQRPLSWQWTADPGQPERSRWHNFFCARRSTRTRTTLNGASGAPATCSSVQASTWTAP